MIAPTPAPFLFIKKKKIKKEITQGEGAGRENIKYAVINNVNKQLYQ